MFQLEAQAQTVVTEPIYYYLHGNKTNGQVRWFAVYRKVIKVLAQEC